MTTIQPRDDVESKTPPPPKKNVLYLKKKTFFLENIAIDLNALSSRFDKSLSLERERKKSFPTEYNNYARGSLETEYFLHISFLIVAEDYTFKLQLTKTPFIRHRTPNKPDTIITAVKSFSLFAKSFPLKAFFFFYPRFLFINRHGTYQFNGPVVSGNNALTSRCSCWIRVSIVMIIFA